MSISGSATAKEVYVTLDSGEVKGFGGCNTIFGSYVVGADTVRFNPVGSTKKFCTTGMDIETKVVEALTLANRYTINNRNLELYNKETLLIRFSPTITGKRRK